MQYLLHLYFFLDKIYRNYDPRLDEIQKEIENNHTETEAKLQELEPKEKTSNTS